LIWIKRQKNSPRIGHTMNVVDVLHGCDLFSAVEPAVFRRLATIARICQFRKEQVIFREGEACPGIYVVGQGLVRVYKRGAGGREHVLHVVGPGGSFAEVAAIGGFAVPAWAQAVKRTTCVLLPQDRFLQALAEDHKLSLGMLSSMAGWVRRLVTLLEDVTLRDAAGRVARYLLALPQSKSAETGSVKLPALKRYVASHLNLTSETFSRTLRRLVEARLIAESGRDCIRLLEPKGLRQVADGLFPRL
jgi:CRP/FNR family transcriptional regulator, dissimilatory nitrate respiration regulator